MTCGRRRPRGKLFERYEHKIGDKNSRPLEWSREQCAKLSRNND
jgi:hypothetical protein